MAWQVWRVLAITLIVAFTTGAQATSLVRNAGDDKRWVSLAGHVNPQALRKFDAGAVPGDLPMVELRWVLKRSSEQAAGMNDLMSAQQTRGSPSYHQWLTPSQFGQRFGASDEDLAAASAWLKSRGFAVGVIPQGRGYLPFSGTAAKVEAAFHTPLHYFIIDGEKHVANTANPQIPGAFQPLVSGIAGLHDFRPKPQVITKSVISHRAARNVSSRPEVNNGGDDNYVGPGDAAVIYNFNPLYKAGLSGSGMKVAVVAQSDIDLTIPAKYWTAFGVNAGQQLSSIATSAATDPGRTGDSAESEAYLDTEIIGGLAPQAQIIIVRDKDIITAITYAIDNNVAPVMNVSFGECEQTLGAAMNAQINNVYQQAVMQGMTILVSTGDSGIASCDDRYRDKPKVTVVSGLSVNGLASTPYDTAVGGTDFNGILVGQGNYWGSNNASGTQVNALSYIPEMVWNESCANPVTAELKTGSNNVISFCNNSQYTSFDVIYGSSGGFSSCVSVDTNGNCNGGYPAPFWQTQFETGTRVIPDVAMLAAGWVFCDESQACGATGTILIGFGTSAAAPAMAAAVLLLDQSKINVNNVDGRQGNINPLLYSLGQYQQAVLNDNTSYQCSADVGAAFTPFCIFHDVQTGNSDQPCQTATYNPRSSSPTSQCNTGTAIYSILTVTTASGSYYPFVAGVGYDLASGLGSINASNFVFTDLSSSETASTGLNANYLGDFHPNFTVWRPSTGYWYTADGAGHTSARAWGASTDIPLLGDFDGDRVSDLAVWRPSTGYWYITQSSDKQVVTHQWGASSDIPVLGDFDGDGRTDIAVWRPSTGYWYIIQSVDNQVVATQFGESTDIPVVGDFDGDGKSDIAVYRPSTGYWYVLQSSNNQVVATQWGNSTDIPVVGDFDGDGKSDIAVYRPSTGYWYIIQSQSGKVQATHWGQSGDIPVSRDYDGDGIADIAVWRQSTGYWYVIQSSNGQVLTKQWGASSDIPINKSQIER